LRTPDAGYAKSGDYRPHIAHRIIRRQEVILPHATKSGLILLGVINISRRVARSEVPIEETWRLEDLFPTLDEWEAALAAIDSEIAAVARYRGRLGEGADVLLECLEAAETLERRFYHVDLYAYLLLAADGTNPANQAIAGRATAAGARVGAGLSFIEPELLGLSGEVVKQYLEVEPGLRPFRRLLEKTLANKPFVLSLETEATLAALGEVMGAPYTLYERAKSSDMSFKPVSDSSGREVPVSFATYEVMLEKSPDTTLRRNAFASFTEGISAYQNILGGTFGTEIKKNVVLAKARGFESATHMFLHRQENSMTAYTNLLNIVQEEVAPHMRRYVELRKKVLGLEKIMYCDIEAPLDPEFDPELTFEEAGRHIVEAARVMGKEYADIIRDALVGRWIDRVDNIGKSTGAFCASAYDAHPYILTTWGNRARSMFTLAHELGHSVADVFTARNQRFANTHMSMFIVESPSTFNEMVLARHVLSQSSDPRVRRWVLMQVLGTYYHDYVRHMIEAELLQRIYDLAEAGTPITASVLSATQGDILNEFWGGLVEVDEGARLTWMRQPHYYMGLYPYTYSAGLTCSTLMAQAIDEEGQPAIDRWLEVLKAGGSVKPLELMRRAGIDLEDPETIRKAVDYVGQLVDEVENSFLEDH
jgi:oligoendopeptidase F